MYLLFNLLVCIRHCSTDSDSVRRKMCTAHFPLFSRCYRTSSTGLPDIKLIFFLVYSVIAVEMASSHSSRSVAELRRENKVWLHTHAFAGLCTSRKNTGWLTKQHMFLNYSRDESRFWSLPGREYEGALHALNVQLVLVGLLTGFANL